jgi:GMP synthase-like glutamine amidotransferase
VARQVPVIGHCLGGQMLAKALGAEVTRNPQPEIGWSRVELVRSADALALAHAWFGAPDAIPPPGVTADVDVAAIDAGGPAHDTSALPVYQWHNETFALPPGAKLLAHNAACAHQAFAIGPHLGMQFHIEVDATKLDRWCGEAPAPGSELAAFGTVQTEAPMRADTARLLAKSQRMASHIYSRWLALAGRRLQKI